MQEIERSSQAKRSKRRRQSWDKNATPAAAAAPYVEVFSGIRPQSLIEERTSDAGMDAAAQRTEVLRRYTTLDVRTDASYVSQFHSKYPSQVFPFTLPYMVGGPEYFSRDQDSRRAFTYELTGQYYEKFVDEKGYEWFPYEPHADKDRIPVVSDFDKRG